MGAGEVGITEEVNDPCGAVSVLHAARQIKTPALPFSLPPAMYADFPHWRDSKNCRCFPIFEAPLAGKICPNDTFCLLLETLPGLQVF